MFGGNIEKITRLGPCQRVTLDCGFPLIAFVTIHSIQGLSLREGMEADISLKGTAIHVLYENR